jgi:hypothetical protein
VQENLLPGVWGESPKIGGYRGLIKSISTMKGEPIGVQNSYL